MDPTQGDTAKVPVSSTEHTIVPQPINVAETHVATVALPVLRVVTETGEKERERAVSAPIEQPILTPQQAKTEHVAATVLPVIKPRGVLTFKPVGKLSDATAKTEFLSKLKMHFAYLPPHEVILANLMAVMESPQINKDPVQNSVREQCGNQLVLVDHDHKQAQKFTKLIENMLTDNLSDEELHELKSEYPHCKNFAELVHGVYDAEGNLQAVAIAGERDSGHGRYFYVDRLANAPWNITRELIKKLQNMESHLKNQGLSQQDLGKSLGVLEKEFAQNIPNDSRMNTGLGSATAMLQQLAKEAHAQKCSSVVLQDASSGDFYSKCGFSPKEMDGERHLDVSDDASSPFQVFLKGQRQARAIL